MKRLSIIILTFVWLCVFELPLLAQEMKIGYNHLKIFIEVQEDFNKPSGLLVDYWVAMAEKMGVSIEWVGPIPPQRIVLYLKQNKIDVAYLASKNKEREAIGFFPEKPITKGQTIICLKKNSSITKIESWSDLKHLNKIGMFHGYRMTTKLAKEYPELNLAIMTQEKFVNTSLSLLNRGKLDAFVFPNKMNVISAIKEKKMESSTKILDAPEPPVLFYALFARGRLDLLEKYNKHHDEVEFAPNY